MQNNKFLSIIIPIYNSENFLKSTLDSCLSAIKDFDDVEIILVDDGSKDNSLSICEEYKRNNSEVVVIHKENGGVSSARNLGLEKAAGEYITFLDSDDIMTENFADAVRSVRENTNIDLFQFPTILVRGEKTQTIYVPQVPAGIYSKGTQEFYGLLNKKLSNSVCNKIIKKQLITENKIKFRPFKTAEDMQFSAKIFLNMQTIYISDIAYYNYILEQDNSAMTAMNISKIVDAFYACEETMQDAEKIEDKKISLSMKKFACRTAYFTLQFYGRLSKEDKNKMIDCISKKKFLFDYPSTKITKFIKIIIKLFGFKFALWLVYQFQKLR